MECATLKDFGSMSTKEILEANAKGQTMTISMDKQYRTRCGFEVRIYAVDSGGLYPIHGAYLFDGVWVACTWEKEGGCLGSSPLDLIEVKPRIQREYWVNVFKNHLLFFLSMIIDFDSSIIL